MKNGTLVAFSSKFTLHGAFNYPLRYIIHCTTKSKVEHVGIICDNFLYESTGHGVVKTLLSKRLVHTESYITVDYHRLTQDLTEDETESLRIDLDAQLGKKYSVIEAIISAIDHILPQWIKNKRSKEISTRKQFCSKLCAFAYRNLGLLDPKILPRNLNPEELINILKDQRLIK